MLLKCCFDWKWKRHLSNYFFYKVIYDWNSCGIDLSAFQVCLRSCCQRLFAYRNFPGKIKNEKQFNNPISCNKANLTYWTHFIWIYHVRAFSFDNSHSSLINSSVLVSLSLNQTASKSYCLSLLQFLSFADICTQCVQPVQISVPSKKVKTTKTTKTYALIHLLAGYVKSAEIDQLLTEIVYEYMLEHCGNE